jgi:Fe-S cluster assembly ATPase SufC
MIKPTKALLLSKGAVAAIGGAKLLAEIERKGYEKFIKNNTSTKTTCQLHKK